MGARDGLRARSGAGRGGWCVLGGARKLVNADELWSDLESHSADLGADSEAELHRTVSTAVGALARAYLLRHGPVSPGVLITEDGPLVVAMVHSTPDSTAKGDEDALVTLGVGRDVAARFVAATRRAEVADAGPVARATGRPVTDAVVALGLVARSAGTDRLAAAMAGVPPGGRWVAWQARALADDLAAWRRAAATAALRLAAPTEAAVAEWEEHRGEELRHATRFLATLEQAGADTLTVASLMVRRLGDVARI